MVSSIGALWDRGVAILNTIREPKTNTMTVNLGDDEGSITESAGAEWWQHIGFASRPSKVTQDEQERRKTGGPQAVILRGSDRDCVVASRDTRTHSLYANLDYGETCVFAPGTDGKAQGRILIKKDGSIYLYTRSGNTSGGDGMTVSLDATNNRATVINGNGFGLIVDEDGVTLTAGDAALVLKSSGSVSLTGKTSTVIDGSSIILGASATPTPLSAAIKGPTGVSGSPSLKVKIE